MDNHVHFIVIPQNEDALAKTFSLTHMSYSQYYNRRVGRIGHLWQGQFYSCAMSEEHLKMALRYVERKARLSPPKIGRPKGSVKK